MPSNLQLGWVMVDTKTLEDYRDGEFEKKYHEILFPYDKNLNDLTKDGVVYYTSAETALKIISNQEIWMRKASMMNDRAEIRHGFEMMQKFFQTEEGKRFFEKTDPTHSGWLKHNWDVLFANQEEIINNTHLMCVSKHSKEENDFGRLSMWRAYGGQSGVALVLHPQVFRPKSMLKFCSHAASVLYWKPSEVSQEFSAMADKIAGNIGALQQLFDEKNQGRSKNVIEYFEGHIARLFFIQYIMCLKHPAFKEEQEIRMFTLGFDPEDNFEFFLTDDVIETIAGIPQKIIKVPLGDKQSLDWNLNKILTRVLIGPTEYPQTLRDSFLEIMRSKGIENPQDRITVTNIPLRPNR